uniref:Uncharacterized protein n=1 Tax=Vespula pensylvanica TaxID=30213 RepID=A0A834NS83_VESPE|nr:hypothetical protein H0235_011498 [Vespula pensylvanica]
MESIQGVAGQRAILPCNIQPREPNDAVTMVLWFKKDSGDPLYSSHMHFRYGVDSHSVIGFHTTSHFTPRYN